MPQRVQRLNMVGSGPHQTKHAGSQQQDNFLNLEWEKDQDKHREGSVQTTHTGKSHFRVRSHISQKKDDNKTLQREINDLKKKLRLVQRKHSPSSSNASEEGDDNYRQMSRTPPSETFSYEEEHHHIHSHKSPSRKGLVNDTMSNEIEGNYDNVAISTFKSGLPIEHGLKKSLTVKPVTSLRQLMDRINKYKRVKEDQQLEKGKAKVVLQEMRDFRSDRFNNNNRSKGDFTGQSRSADSQTVHVVFQDPVHQVLEKIKNEPFFKWPNKMAGDPMKHNQNLYCQYHQELGHTTEDCRNLRYHLDQLVR